MADLEGICGALARENEILARQLEELGGLIVSSCGAIYTHQGLQSEPGPAFDAAINNLCDELLPLAESGNFRAVASKFAKIVPALPDLPSDQAWQRAAHYNLALALGMAARIDSARKNMELAELPAGGDYDALIYPHRLASGMWLKRRQERAMAANMPAIVIASLPKSASAFVSNTLARLLDVPVLRASFGGMEQGCVVESWVRQINRGGCVTHEHFGSTFGNIETLARAGLRRVFVQVRDPRAAIWSLYHHELDRRTGTWTQPEFESAFESWYTIFVRWLENWLEANENTLGLEIVFISYEDVRLAPADSLARILSLAGLSLAESAVHALIEGDIAAGRKPDNFRVGEPDSWRRHIPSTIQERLWTLTPKAVREFLEMVE